MALQLLKEAVPLVLPMHYGFGKLPIRFRRLSVQLRKERYAMLCSPFDAPFVSMPTGADYRCSELHRASVNQCRNCRGAGTGDACPSSLLS